MWKHALRVSVISIFITGLFGCSIESGPKNFEECLVNAAKSASTDFGAQLMEKLCISKYPDGYTKHMERVEKAISSTLKTQPFPMQGMMPPMTAPGVMPPQDGVPGAVEPMGQGEVIPDELMSPDMLTPEMLNDNGSLDESTGLITPEKSEDGVAAPADPEVSAENSQQGY